MTNSESPSPKKEENNHDYSFSAASDDEAEFDNVQVNEVLKDLNPSKQQSSLVDDDTKLMDRKRLRIFTAITKKKTVDMSKDKGKLSEFDSGSFL